MVLLDKFYKTVSTGLVICTILAAGYSLQMGKHTMERYHELKKDPNFKLKTLPKAEDEVNFDLIDEEVPKEEKK